MGSLVPCLQWIFGQFITDGIRTADSNENDNFAVFSESNACLVPAADAVNLMTGSKILQTFRYADVFLDSFDQDKNESRGDAVNIQHIADTDADDVQSRGELQPVMEKVPALPGENKSAEPVNILPEASLINPVVVSSVAAIPLLILILTFALILGVKRKKALRLPYLVR